MYKMKEVELLCIISVPDYLVCVCVCVLCRCALAWGPLVCPRQACHLAHAPHSKQCSSSSSSALSQAAAAEEAADVRVAAAAATGVIRMKLEQALLLLQLVV
jgi:hypothetical protein